MTGVEFILVAMFQHGLREAHTFAVRVATIQECERVANEARAMTKNMWEDSLRFKCIPVSKLPVAEK